MPKISVIIPVYNVEQYLRECLDSVVNQTLKDIEIICINDGSTDCSLEICNEYAQKDCRITVLSQQNEGSGHARNRGIKVASGEFVIFLDADDFYPENDILETLYNKAKENNVLICGGSFSGFVNRCTKTNYNGTFAGYTFSKDGKIEYADYQFDYGYHRFIYNLNFLKENNIYFPCYRRFQDPPFFTKAMYKAKEFYALAKITYVLRGGHKIINWTNQKKQDLLDGIKENLDFAKEHNLEKLYYLTCERLNQHAYAFDNIKFRLTLTDIIKMRDIVKDLDWKILKKYDPYFKINKNYKILNQITQQIFSIKNIKNHKVISILGLKIKIKKGKKKELNVRKK